MIINLDSTLPCGHSAVEYTIVTDREGKEVTRCQSINTDTGDAQVISLDQIGETNGYLKTITVKNCMARCRICKTLVTPKRPSKSIDN